MVVYNRAVFGMWTLRGGYGAQFTTGAIERFRFLDYLANVWEMFVGLPNGVLTTTPIIGVAVVGAGFAWKEIPGWAKSMALAGVGYLLVHAALNRASGGAVVFYRYPLEPIVLAAPLLALGASYLWGRAGRWRQLVGVSVVISVVLILSYQLVPRLMDEIPVLAVGAAVARGTTRIRDAAELRVKESDRIAALMRELGKMGARLTERQDGLDIEGPSRLRGAHVASGGDHRLAMALAVAGLVADGKTVIDDTACIATSFPEFVDLLNTLAGGEAVTVEP